MALKATWVDSVPDTTGKAQELIEAGFKGLDGDRHIYSVTGPKEELEAYIAEVKTDSYNPVDESGNVTFTTLFPSISDVCTLYRSRKINVKTGKHNYGLNESAFKRLDSQTSRIKNTLLQSKLIDAKFDSVMGLKTTAVAAEAIQSMSLDEEDDSEETAKPKAKAKANAETDAE
jgi:hypothetical protein